MDQGSLWQPTAQRDIGSRPSAGTIEATVEALPCPFCGAPAHWAIRSSGAGIVWCNVEACAAQPRIDARSIELALQAWNARPVPR